MLRVTTWYTVVQCRGQFNDMMVMFLLFLAEIRRSLLVNLLQGS